MAQSQEQRKSISVLIPAGNEARNIRDCIACVRDWADEVFVVDSFSQDETPQIAAEMGVRLVQHEYVNSATQKNWAIPQCSHEWVLVVDCDERVTPQLRDEILQVLRDDAAGRPVSDGYRIGRLNHFLGQKVRYCGWQNDTCLRLFRRDMSRYQDRHVHADVIVSSGRVGELKAQFLHYTFHSFAQYMKKHDQMTSWGANDRAKRTERVGVMHLFWRPLFRFFKQYVLKLGFLDGRVGLIVCTLAAYSVFMKYAKLYEIRLKESGGAGE